MRISTKGRYGLRTLMDIAIHQGDGPVTLNDISRRQDISVKYLWQVINPLKTSGILSVTRGARGGYTLAKRPEEITMLEVVSVLEGPLALVDCLGKDSLCERIDSCVARSVWKEVGAAVERVLSGIRFDEVLKRYEDSSDVNNFVI